MKVRMLVEFDVEPLVDDPDGEFSENLAKSAASEAVYNFLTFCTVSGVNTDCDEVEVHAEGFGACKVSLGSNHE